MIARRHRRVAACVVCAFACTAVAADAVRVTRLDGSVVRGHWAGAEAGTLRIDASATESIPLDQVWRVAFDAVRPASARPADSVLLRWCDGSRLTGRILGSTDSGLRVALGDQPDDAAITIPFDALAGVWLHDPKGAVEQARTLYADTRVQRRPGNDVLLTLADGKLGTLPGGVLTLNARGGTIWFGGRERAFSTDIVFAVVFAQRLDPPPPSSLAVQWAGDELIRGRLDRADAERLVVRTFFNAEVAVPIASIAELEFASPLLVFVSDLTPVDQQSTGLIHRPTPPRMDRSVANQPLSIAGQRCERGIGMQSRTALTFALGGQYETFAATIGIDDAVRPGGDVVFTVLGDGTVLVDSGSVTGHDAPRDILVNVHGVDRLTLVADVGRDLDLADYADWGDARLIRAPTGTGAP